MISSISVAIKPNTDTDTALGRGKKLEKINICLSYLSIDAFCNAGVQPLLGKAPSACVLDNGLIKWKYELRNQIVQYESVTPSVQNKTFICFSVFA